MTTLQSSETQFKILNNKKLLLHIEEVKKYKIKVNQRKYEAEQETIKLEELLLNKEAAKLFLEKEQLLLEIKESEHDALAQENKNEYLKTIIKNFELTEQNPNIVSQETIIYDKPIDTLDITTKQKRKFLNTNLDDVTKNTNLDNVDANIKNNQQFNKKPLSFDDFCKNINYEKPLCTKTNCNGYKCFLVHLPDGYCKFGKNCLNSICHRVHETTIRKTIICASCFYEMECANDYCTFGHLSKQDINKCKSKNMCLHFFSTGNCFNSNNCKFNHYF